MDKDLKKQKARKYYLANRDRQLQEAKTRYASDSDFRLAKRQQNKEWVAKHPDRARAFRRQWHQKNKHRIVPWSKKNPEKRREVARNYQRRKRATPKGALDHRMTNGILSALKAAKAGYCWESLVGYTLDDLVRHIESRFTPGMNWDRLANGEIHIDHVIPKSKFSYVTFTDPEFRRCWALDNLQPMWRQKNLSKHDRLEKHEQIALGV